MNLFYIIIFLAISIPLILKNKKWGLIISMLLLFIPWGFQYQLTQDWDVYVIRWMHVNFNERIELDGGEDRKLEALYVLILKACKPLSFYGFLILSAIFELYILYIFIKKYVSPDYYWVVIFILMMKVEFGLLLIDTNRQSLSVFFLMLGMYIILNTQFPKSDYLKPFLLYIIGFTIILLSPRIHGTAALSFLIIPFYIYAKHVKNANRFILFVIFNFLFVLRYYVDAKQYQFGISLFMDSINIEGVDFFERYLDGLDNSVDKSSYNVIIEASIMNLSIYYYNKLPTAHRIFALMWFTSFVLDGFLIGSLGRIRMYFYIYFLFLIPKLMEYTYESFSEKNAVVRSIWALVLVYFLLSFIKQMTNDTEGYFYYRWSNFTTIFSAPEWI